MESCDGRSQADISADARAEQQLADRWREYYEALSAPSRAWADLLMRHEWHQFWTLTFAPQAESYGGGVHPEKADKAFRLLCSSINRSIWGPRWHKKPHSGIVWARGQEFHRDGRIHFHAVVAGPDRDLNTSMRRLTWMDWWSARFGWARMERPESQGDICGYVSKYTTKGGEVDLSPNFGRYQPPGLFG